MVTQNIDVQLLNAVTAGAAEGEQSGCITPAVVDALREARLFDLWRPGALGGLECEPVSLAEQVADLATADAAAAWLVFVTSAAWFDLRGGHPDLLEEIVSNTQSPVLAETFNSAMTAQVDGKGWRVSGRAAFASGCRVADWVAHTARAGDELLLMFHPRDALEIVDDWHTSGMRGTCSNSIVAEHVYVPAHRVIHLQAERVCTPAFSTPLYTAPEALVVTAMPAVALGVWHGALEAMTALANRKVPFASADPLSHRQSAQTAFGTSLAGYRAAREYLRRTLETQWRALDDGHTATAEDKAALFLCYAHTVQSARDGVDRLMRAAGTSGVFTAHAIGRAQRDIQVIAQHAFGAEGRFASAAQALWDLPVDFPLLLMD